MSETAPESYARVLIVVGVIAAYHLFFWHKYGATPGKLLLKLRMVDAETGASPSFAQCVARLIAEGVGLLVVVVDYAVGLSNRNRRTLHDYLSQTRVISTALAAQMASRPGC